jgi:hypothetical protein
MGLAAPTGKLMRAFKGAIDRVTRPMRPQRAPIPLDWRPTSKASWSFVDTVKAFQAKTPANVQRKLDAAAPKQLADAHSVTYTQKVDDQLGRGPRRAAVQITQGVVNAPLKTFLARLPAEKWGVSLDHYLGGAVEVAQQEGAGRPFRQVERMVLSGLPGNLNIRALNLDMSKVEQKEVEKDSSGNLKRVTMYWRVHDSANRTTLMDIGSVSFEAYGGDQTKVVFHSAHRLGKNPIALPTFLVRPTLKSFFSDHVRHYRALVEK